MFRNMRRINQQVSEEKCIEVLINGQRAVLSLYGTDGYPYGVPVNYTYDVEENIIYIHGAKIGHKIDAIAQNDKVCFTTWDNGFHKEDDWAWWITSVIAFGRAELVTDSETTLKQVRSLGLKYFPTSEEVDKEIERSLSAVQLIAIHIEHMTGKLVHEK